MAVILVSSKVRFMRIFAGVRWRGRIKRERGRRHATLNSTASSHAKTPLSHHPLQRSCSRTRPVHFAPGPPHISDNAEVSVNSEGVTGRSPECDACHHGYLGSLMYSVFMYFSI